MIPIPGSVTLANFLPGTVGFCPSASRYAAWEWLPLISHNRQL